MYHVKESVHTVFIGNYKGQASVLKNLFSIVMRTIVYCISIAIE